MTRNWPVSVLVFESHLLLHITSVGEVHLQLFSCTASLSLAGSGECKVRMPAHRLMWCPVTGWELVGCHVSPLPPPKAPPSSHVTGENNFTDASIRTQALTKRAYWWAGDASSKLVLSHRDKRNGDRVIGRECGLEDHYLGWRWGCFIPSGLTSDEF